MNDVNFDIVVRKLPWWKPLLSQVADTESIPAILLKADSTTEAFTHGFCNIALLKTSLIFLIFFAKLLRKLQASNPQAATYEKCYFWQKYIELNFDSKWNLYCVKNNFIFEYPCWCCKCQELMPRFPRRPLHVEKLKFSLGRNFIPGWNYFRLHGHFNPLWEQEYFNPGWTQKHHFQYVLRHDI